MKPERLPHVPAKSRLSWRICRLRLETAGWLATGSKGSRVAVIQLPELADPAFEDAWVAEIEARFEEQAFEPGSEAAEARVAHIAGIYRLNSA